MRLFQRNNEYPVINVYLPNTLNSFHFELVGNGDFNIENDFFIKKMSLKLDGNGDVFSNKKLVFSQCYIEVLKNGDVKFTNIKGDTLKYKIRDNGDFIMQGVFKFKEKL